MKYVTVTAKTATRILKALTGETLSQMKITKEISYAERMFPIGGAKLVKSRRGKRTEYYISGYAQDESDITSAILWCENNGIAPLMDGRMRRMNSYVLHTEKN